MDVSVETFPEQNADRMGRDSKKDRMLWAGMAFLSFFLPIVLVLLVFMIRGMYPFGNKCFLVYDMYHQYYPFFAEFIHKIRDGESLYYSYNVGIGSNFTALYVYYIASPFNWLGLLVREEHLIEFLSYLAVFRFGLCGFSAFYYLEHHFEKKRAEALIFSLLYAFSGFMAAYNYNVMWIDCVALLPVIVLGLEKLVKEGKCGMYCIALALSILTNYYISIMICIFLVLYFLTLLITQKGGWKAVARFALYSLLAGGLAAVLLIPEVCAILATDFSDMDFPKRLERYFSILDVLARHSVCVYNERGLDHWPNIYCGTLVFFMIPMYLTNQEIPLRRKFCNMALAGLFLFSFSTNITDFIWHGMNYPDSLPARQSFLYIFLVIGMCYEAYLHMDQVSEKYILYGYLAGIAFLLFCEKFVDTDHYETDILFVSILFMTVFAVLVYLMRVKKESMVRQILCYLMLMFMLAEVFVNSYVTSLGTVSRVEYTRDWEDYKALSKAALQKEEQGIYRIEKFTRKTKNDGTMIGYPTASVFSSTLNSQVMDLYKKLGMQNSKVFYGYDGATPLVAALLNVNWMLGKGTDYSNLLYEQEEKSGDLTLYRAMHRLPFGYTAPAGFDLPANTSSIRLQNSLVKKLGITGNLFEFVPVKSDGDNVIVQATKTGVHYAVISASGTKKVKLSGGKLDGAEYKDLKKDCIVYLGSMEKNETVTIKNGDDSDTTPKVSVECYVLNEEILKKTLELLGSTHLENVTADTTHVSGEIALSEDKRLILSIPYEKGWSIWVDGEKTECDTFGGALIALELTAGRHEIRMQYVPYGLYAGIIISLCSLAVFVAVMLLAHTQRRKKQRKKQIHQELLTGDKFDV